jgi:hypothetical protein
MALFRWRGNGAGTKSDWSDGRNWVDGAGAAYAVGVYPGVVPAQHDDVIFDQALEAGALSVAGRDCAADEPLLSFAVGPTYDGTIGTSGTWLQVDVNEATSYVNIDGSGMAAGGIYLDSAGGALNRVLVEGGNVHLDGAIADLTVLKGTVEIAAAAVVTVLFYVGLKTLESDATVSILAGATLCDVVQASGGVTCNAASANDLYISGGSWVQAAGALSGVVRVFGGTFYWNAATLTSLFVFGGLATAAFSALTRTLTNARVYLGATLNLDNGMNNITLTNPVEVQDGTVIWPTGRRVS